MRLSEHFTLQEAERSFEATRMGIDNSAPQEVIPHLRYMAKTVLEPLRAHFGVPFSPTSWYRCEALERAITWESGFKSWADARGLPYSDASWDAYFSKKTHPKGFAVDVELPGLANDTLFWWCADLRVQQVIREFPKVGEPTSGWVHVTCWEGGPPTTKTFSLPARAEYRGFHAW